MMLIAKFAALIDEWAGLRQQPERAAGRLVDGVGEHLGRGLVAHQPAAGEVVDVDGLALFVGDHEAGGELAGPGAGDVLGRRPAEQPGRRLVGVDRAALVVIDRHRLREAVEDAVQARSRGPQVADQPRVGQHQRDPPGHDREELQVLLRRRRRSSS